MLCKELQVSMKQGVCLEVFFLCAVGKLHENFTGPLRHARERVQF